MDNNNDSKYICTIDEKVFKITPTHFLQLSPWNDGDDRRVYEMSDENYHIITYQNACMIVNKQFQDIDERWQRNDKHYIARKNNQDRSPYEIAAIINMLPSHELVTQMSSILGQLPDDSQLSIQNEKTEFKMIRHNGKINYVLIVDEYLPRVQLYDTFGKFCKWANIKNIKPIFCETDKRYI